jgi:threonylcarbamoyladenosine tRNA methylthiotransferase MtaB
MISKTIAFHHFGCKVNFAEVSTLSRQFHENGYTIVDFHDEADIYVISTCVVTAIAEKKCRAAIRQAHRLNPSAKIAVIGCFPELKQEEIQRIDGVNVILGHSAKFGLLEEIKNLETGTKEIPLSRPDEKSFIPSYSYGDRTRSFLKIQDGCDYYCAYCTIPLARGHSRSDSIENVVDNVQRIIGTGVQEIILTGVNIGDFGRQNLETLLELLITLETIETLPRLRISSIEPDLITPEIIDLIAASSKIMPHFHIPLQSGSDVILKAMKRKYNLALYESRIKKIRSVLPNACIAADVITGFPGETEEDFKNGLQFLENTDLSYMHVFTYSKRENTLAAKIPDPVHESIKKERSRLLHELSDRKKTTFYQRSRGMETRVLFESDNNAGMIHGFTENYIKVKTTFSEDLVNRIMPVKLEQLEDDMTYLWNA